MYTLHPYQREAVAFAADRQRTILSMPVGSGKTLTATDWCRAKKFNRVIWVVPPELMDSGRDEIEKWFGHLPKAPPVFQLEAVASRRKSDGHWGIWGLPRRCVVMVAWCNVDLVEDELWWLLDRRTSGLERALLEKAEGRPKWAQGLELPPESGRVGLVFDEAQKGNSPERYTKAFSKGVPWQEPYVTPTGRKLFPLRSQAAAASRLVPFAHSVLAKTASTITEHRQDIYGLVRLLYSASETRQILRLPGNGYLSDFRVKYCGAVPGDYALTNTGPTHNQELLACLRRIMFSVPPEVVSQYMLPMKASGVAVLAKAPWYHVPNRGTPKVLTAMQRLAGALDHLRNNLPEGTSLVFTEYKETARVVAEELGAPLITGDTKRSERRRLLAEHRKVGGPLVATLYALGHGFNLQYVDAIRMVEVPIRMDLFLQGLGRGQRLNREVPLDLQVIAVRNSYDSHTLEVWSKKIAATRDLSAHDTSPAEAAKSGATAVDWSLFARRLAPSGAVGR